MEKVFCFGRFSSEIISKIARPSPIRGSLALTLKDDTTDNKRTEKDKQNANASQN